MKKLSNNQIVKTYEELTSEELDNLIFASGDTKEDWATYFCEYKKDGSLNRCKPYRRTEAKSRQIKENSKKANILDWCKADPVLGKDKKSRAIAKKKIAKYLDEQENRIRVINAVIDYKGAYSRYDYLQDNAKNYVIDSPKELAQLEEFKQWVDELEELEGIFCLHGDDKAFFDSYDEAAKIVFNSFRELDLYWSWVWCDTVNDIFDDCYIDYIKDIKTIDDKDLFLFSQSPDYDKLVKYICPDDDWETWEKYVDNVSWLTSTKSADGDEYVKDVSFYNDNGETYCEITWKYIGDEIDYLNPIHDDEAWQYCYYEIDNNMYILHQFKRISNDDITKAIEEQ